MRKEFNARLFVKGFHTVCEMEFLDKEQIAGKVMRVLGAIDTFTPYEEYKRIVFNEVKNAHVANCIECIISKYYDLMYDDCAYQYQLVCMIDNHEELAEIDEFLKNNCAL